MYLDTLIFLPRCLLCRGFSSHGCSAAPPGYAAVTLRQRVRQTWSLTVYFCLVGETNHGGGSDQEICARRQQPHHILLW